MPQLKLWTLLSALVRLTAAEFGVAGQLFALQGSSDVNNAKLAWAAVNSASTYRVEQKTGTGEYSTAATVSGTAHDIYNLNAGSTYSFRITALNGNNQVDQSSIATLVPYTAQGTYSTHDNTQPSSTRLKSKLEANGVYYQYNYEAYSNGSFNRFVEQTSSNGYDFTGDKTVLTGATLCAPANYSCKLEAVTFLKNPSTNQFVMYAHYEKSQDYSLGWIAVAHKDPTADTLTFDGAYQPLGHDSRDLGFFNDGDAAWIVTSTDTNTNNNIYSLTSNWTAIDHFVVQVNQGGHREAPAVAKSNGLYYLFTSRAAGWLPSQPQYISASSMAGPWSSPVDVANTATFGSQSGGVSLLSSGQLEMNSNRWSSNWPTQGGPTRQLMLPISECSSAPQGSEGFVSYHYYRTVKYSDDITATGQGIYGVQSGRILSNGRPSSSSAGDANISAANDGIQNDPANVFVPSSVPFWYQIDLQDSHAISQVDLTTKLVQGSETFYNYNVTGSADGQTFEVLADRSNAVDVGFSASFPTTTQRYRYIRINVESVINNINGHAASWAAGIHEVTVYGS
ncbi:carbohydrate-binding module family 32 protein [Cercospora zeae-maydis SCOH1-5]|uniref:Carbohydrate-binding module family 32 protein n=1 Tax=Cercospora zeae-maydis SCOH1-5 TaxID=717836 RepID=A0A6A6FB58_9PEZI|nr:carbohydrate-binding module family 32 protein [Cercospora zeae-maydis SCOH1-5]